MRGTTKGTAAGDTSRGTDGTTKTGKATPTKAIKAATKVGDGTTATTGRPTMGPDSMPAKVGKSTAKKGKSQTTMEGRKTTKDKTRTT
jgi:hypothetical protein